MCVYRIGTVVFGLIISVVYFSITVFFMLSSRYPVVFFYTSTANEVIIAENTAACFVHVQAITRLYTQPLVQAVVALPKKWV